MTCINTSHQEFQSLLKETGKSSLELELDVAAWQQTQNSDLFPTAQELYPEERVEKINYQKLSTEELVASEKTLRDLAARMSDRIGIPYKIISDRTQKFKGKLQRGTVEDYGPNSTGFTAVINLAYASLDTPIHEILGHPIIKAIKSKVDIISEENNLGDENTPFQLGKINIGQGKGLYQNLLKELETGRGKEVLDRIKRDYEFKEENIIDEDLPAINKYGLSLDAFIEAAINLGQTLEEVIKDVNNNYKLADGEWLYFNRRPLEPEFSGDYTEILTTKNEVYAKLNLKQYIKYTLEEQQEEAIVELLGLMTAEKLDNVKDGKLISLLKRLLKEMKAFLSSLIKQKEVEVDNLPDNMTLGDLSDLLAYSNSKLILPGYEVIYTTPDNMKFKTYQEASKHISDLDRSVKDVDLSAIKIGEYINLGGDSPIERLAQFIEKNKEYEQAKEIIEEWKKINNIQYNPKEIYSRGQEFSSVVGAYSSFDVNLMMQNLLSHIEDNEKSGGKFAISAYTKPIDKKIGHLEGGGGKIKFKIYPKSEDILWASNIDAYSGSVWDASTKVNKDKKSELLGVSYTKYPSLQTIYSVQPNLANIVEDIKHAHNELGIVLTGNNFRLEYDEDIPYTTKKIIEGINKILDQKYGKVVKPIINKTTLLIDISKEEYKNAVSKGVNKLREDGYNYIEYNGYEYHAPEPPNFSYSKNKIGEFNYKSILQPTQTNNTLKESIRSVKSKLNSYRDNFEKTTNFEGLKIVLNKPDVFNSFPFSIINRLGETITGVQSKEDGEKLIKELNSRKEYTSQALINIKIAALKEVAKKYPRSLIRSEVIGTNKQGSKPQLFGDDLPFQKLQSSLDYYTDEDFKKMSEEYDNFLVEEYEYLSKPNEISYKLKAVEILNTTKAKKTFEKGEKNLWTLNKILTELQIPKEQRELILEFGLDKRTDILERLKSLQFSVEINTTKAKNTVIVENNNRYFEYVDEEPNRELTKEEYEREKNKTSPSQYYSNLTVPGGTNYTEQEIATPQIVPSIKGHAQFATDNGIGWFRSDDKLIITEQRMVSYDGTVIIHSMNDVLNKDATKTRRILEVQSDLFQKGRDKKDLSTKDFGLDPDFFRENFDSVEEMKKYESTAMLNDNNTPENQFLQLLNKNSNWVTFFIKGIVQDSEKRGYEKVLFPSGDTASKVEGHSTVEEFKKQKEDRIQLLESTVFDKTNLLTEFEKNDDVYINHYGFKSDYNYVRIRQNYWNRDYDVDDKRTLSGDSYDGYVIQEYTNGQPQKITKITKQEALELIKKSEEGLDIEVLESNKRELAQLKQELESVERDGLAALKPIWNFYENVVSKITKKLYNSETVTDEYGNTWQEITLVENNVVPLPEDLNDFINFDKICLL